ncbi:MAG: flippase-like domain-containing protein [Nitrospirae bacterium]|nr:flippase-like domain-containing protein [Nitrospirota bacterium]
MKPLYKRIIGILLVSVVFYFIGRMVYREWNGIAGYDWTPHLLWLIVSTLTLSLVYILAASGWTLIMRFIGVEIGWLRGLWIFLLSMFGRYIPGGVWSALGRLYLCRLEGIPDSKSGAGILLEQVYPIISAGFVFALSLLFWNDTDVVVKFLPMMAMIPLLAVFLHPKSFLKIINPVLARLGKKPIHVSLSFRHMATLFLFYSIYWIVSGIAFFFFVRAFYPVATHSVPILIGIYAISFTVGYLTFFTPAGLGVREGTLSILLSFMMPASVAVGLALLSRLWLLGVELLIAVAFLIHEDSRKRVRTVLGW